MSTQNFVTQPIGRRGPGGTNGTNAVGNPIVETLAQVQALDETQIQKVLVTDGTIFEWIPTSTENADGGVTVSKPGNTGNGNWQRNFEGPFKAGWWQTKFDGATNDRPALKTAATAAAGAKLELPNGTAKIQLAASGDVLDDVSNMSIKGQGQTETELAFDVSQVDESVNTQRFMIPGDDFSLLDMSLSISDEAPGEDTKFYVFITPEKSLTLENVTIDGGITPVNGSLPFDAHGINLSKNIDRLLVRNVHFKNLNRSILKSNTDTAYTRNVDFVGVTTSGMGSESSAFNSPVAEMRRVRYINSTNYDNISASVGREGHFFGGAGMKEVIFTGNFDYGPGDETGHFESDVELFVLSGNVSNKDEASGCYTLQSNNLGAGGIDRHPKYGVISNNIAKNGNGTGKGLAFLNDGTTSPSGEYVLINNCVAINYATAGQIARVPGRNLFTGNILVESTYGMQAILPSTTVFDNLLAENTTVYKAAATGFFGHNHIAVVSAWDGTTPLIDSYFDVAASHEAGALGVSITKDGDITFATGVNDYKIMVMPDRMPKTELTLSIYGSAAARKYAVWDVTYDGATYDATGPTPHGAGLLLIVDLIKLTEGGTDYLAVKINNATGAAISGGRLQLALRGLHTYNG